MNDKETRSDIITVKSADGTSKNIVVTIEGISQPSSSDTPMTPSSPTTNNAPTTASGPTTGDTPTTASGPTTGDTPTTGIGPVPELNYAPHILSTNNILTSFAQNDNTVIHISDLCNIDDANGNVMQGIAITSIDTSVGLWSYSTDEGKTWKSIALGDSTQAFLVKSTDCIRFTANDANYLGSSAISFRAWDQSQGNAYSYVRIDSSAIGGNGAFSTELGTTNLSNTVIIDLKSSKFLNGETYSGSNQIQSAMIINGDTNVSLDSSFFSRLSNITSVIFSDGSSYSVTLNGEPNVTQLDFSRVSNGYSTQVDASLAPNAISVIGSTGNDTVVLGNGSLNSSLNLGGGNDTLMLTGSNFNDQMAGKLVGVEQIDASKMASNSQITLSDKIVNASDQHMLTINSGINNIKVDASSVSTDNKIFLAGSGTVTVTGTAGQTLYEKSGSVPNIVIDANNVSLVTTAANLSLNQRIDSAPGRNTVVRVVDSGSNLGNTINLAEKIGSIWFNAEYKQLVFNSGNDPVNGTHYTVNLDSMYAGHTEASGVKANSYSDGGTTYVSSTTYYTKTLNYDASQLGAHDSIDIDATQFANKTGTPRNITGPFDNHCFVNINITGGNGDDSFKIPTFDFITKTVGMLPVYSKFYIVVNVAMGAGDDTITLTDEKLFTMKGTYGANVLGQILGGPNQVIFDGGSDTAGSGPDGLGRGDTLQISGANREISLDVIGKYFKNMELIDLGENQADGSGKYSLNLSLNSMLQFSDTRDDLVIKGGSDDTVKLSLNDHWTAAGNQQIDSHNYKVYSTPDNAVAKLYVQEDINVLIS